MTVSSNIFISHRYNREQPSYGYIFLFSHPDSIFAPSKLYPETLCC